MQQQAMVLGCRAYAEWCTKRLGEVAIVHWRQPFIKDGVAGFGRATGGGGGVFWDPILFFGQLGPS